jgi:hypothetical protein
VDLVKDPARWTTDPSANIVERLDRLRAKGTAKRSGTTARRCMAKTIEANCFTMRLWNPSLTPRVGMEECGFAWFAYGLWSKV